MKKQPTQEFRFLLAAVVFGCGILLSSCGVSEPDAAVWEDVSAFSWPTETGSFMKYRTTIGDSIVGDEEITVDVAAANSPLATYDGRPMYVLNNPTQPYFSQVHFLPFHDSLIVKQEKFGGELALLAPLEKGHRWYSSRDSVWEAEIIERFAYRKVEGKVYSNVVVVKYRRSASLGSIYDDEEWIRFYAEGVGEITTIRNVYPKSSSSAQTLPRQEELKVLVESSAAN